MEPNTETPIIKSLIEQIAEIQGKAAEAYIPAIEGTPKEIADEFHWADHLTKPESYLLRLQKFFENHLDFPVSQQEIANAWQSAFDQADEIYQILFPEGAPQLAYHNLIHAKITAVTANKMILGALTTTPEYQDMDPNRMLSLIKLSAIAAVFHEINDWWCLGGNPNLGKAKNELVKFLTKQGLSTVDFNRLIALDHFKRKVPDIVKEVLNPSTMRDEDKFLPDNRVPPITDESFLTLFGNILVSADFSQILNPGYHQPANVSVDDKTYTTSAVSTALAVEAAAVRPNALLEIGFGNADGVISWENVKFDANFAQYALSRIKDGFSHLKDFDSEEYKRAYGTLEAIGIKFDLADYFHENFPNAAKP